MAEASKGGWLRRALISVAAMRPRAPASFTVSLPVGLAAFSMRESASLTARLQTFGTTKVMRVRQCRAVPNRDERWFLDATMRRPANQSVMVREVVLKVDGVPWVFAHTLANASAMRLLRRAGRNALAVVLFTDPQVDAGPLQYRRVDVRHPLYRAAQSWCDVSSGNPLSLMARRALFTRGAARLLVTEVFLPPVVSAPSTLRR